MNECKRGMASLNLKEPYCLDTKAIAILLNPFSFYKFF